MHQSMDRERSVKLIKVAGYDHGSHYLYALSATNMSKNIALVINPTTHNAKALSMAEEVSGILNERHIPNERFAGKWPASYDAFSDVWIFGGDGTLNFFINENPDIQLPLSVFPGGTGNDFHYMVYGDINVASQVDGILKGDTRVLDAGICNGRLFLNGIGVGFDGAIVKDLMGRSKMTGKSAYLLSIMKNIIGYSEKKCELRTNRTYLNKTCFMITVANGKRYGGDFHVAPKAMLDDGLLEISVIGEISPVKRMKYLGVIQKGEHLDLPFIDYTQDENITIKCEKEMHAHIDGEYIFSSSYRIHCLPGKFVFSTVG